METVDSPFPGMDPYLESPAYWQDFHATFVPALREQINAVLPDHYVARIEEEVVLLQPEAAKRHARPDVLVDRDPLAPSGGGGSLSPGGAAVAQLAPETLHNVVHLDPHTQTEIRILHLPHREVVTVVEVLSPTNKDGDGRGIYIEKRNRLLHRSINVVELDLLRAGRRIELVEPLPPGHYYALVSRADRRPECQVYTWTVRQPLPVIPIPLKAPEPDVKVDLAAAFRTAYQRGRYQRMVPYDAAPPGPGLGAAEVEWATRLAAELRR